MREIVIDTETTGLDPKKGDRIIEIGCLELNNHISTGRTLHLYINPERPIPPDATQIHGITDAMLVDKPLFGEIAEEMIAFLADDTLVIHNASFDLGFLNMELGLVGLPALAAGRAVDTVALARRRFPGSPASLDALCKRFGIDNSARTKHGALLDAELLASVYVELIGGRQHGLGLTVDAATLGQAAALIERPFREARPHVASDAERAAHEAFLEKVENPVWKR